MRLWQRTIGWQLLAGLAVTIGAFMLLTPTASAYLNNQSPDPNHIEPSPNKFGHLVSSASYINVSSMHLVIYAETNKIAIAIPNADMCEDPTILYGMKDNYNSLMNGYTNGSPVTSFKASGAPAVTGVKNTNCGPEAAKSQVIQDGDPVGVTLASTTKLITATSSTSINTSLGTLYKYTFDADWASGCRYSGTQSCGVNYFMVKALLVQSGKYKNGNILVSQVSGSTVTASENAIGGYGNDPTSFSSFAIEFGADCSVQPNTEQAIDLYDDDNWNVSGAQDPSRPFGVRMEERPKGAPASSWTDRPFNNIKVDGQPNDIPPGSGPSGILKRNDVKDYTTAAGLRPWLEVGTEGSLNMVHLLFSVTPGYEYRLTLRSIDPHNNLQFTYPYESVWSYVDCNNFTPDTDKVVVQPFVTGAADEDSNGAVFDLHAKIGNFPVDPHKWGYNSDAVRLAIDTGITPSTFYYNSNPNTQIGTTNLEAQCGGGSWRGTPTSATDCAGNQYLCVDGGIHQDCRNPSNDNSGYRYRCTDIPGQPGSGFAFNDNHDPRNGINLPTGPCRYYQHDCKNSSFKNFNTGVATCGDRYQCKKSNGNPVGPIQDSPGFNCKIYRCAYDAPGTNEFYEPGNANANCQRRCNGGYGNPAPLKDSGDQHCYVSPSFQIHCTWNGPEGSTALETVNITNYGNDFCVSRITRYGPVNAEGKICANAVAAGKNVDIPTQHGFVWEEDGVNSMEPGRGKNNNYGVFRTKWSFNVLTAADVCAPVGASPYFSVLGGDIAAGPNFKAGASCAPFGSTPSSVIGSNRNAPPYNGSTGQLAALAANDVRLFATSKQQTYAAPPWKDSLALPPVTPYPNYGSPSQLVFANLTANGAIYGGSLGVGSSWCVPDYYDDVSTASATAPPGNTNALAAVTTDTTYWKNGNLTLGVGTQLIQPYGQKIIIKVKGNVYIRKALVNGGDKIAYDTAAAAGDLTKLPQLQIIAGGNVYVDPEITQLDGFYVAQGVNTVNGISGAFASCATGLDANVAKPLYGLTAVAPCKTKLTVNGGIAAKQVVFNRTRGDRNARFLEPLEPAETVQFSPQFWLPQALKKDLGPWQSVTNLPPIL